MLRPKQKMPIQEKVDIITCYVCVVLLFGCACMYLWSFS
jgi:hypothetical protein